MDTLGISRQAIDAAIRQAFPEATNPLPLTPVPSEIYGSHIQCIQIGTQQMALPHVGARYSEDGERVSPGVDPQLLIMRGPSKSFVLCLLSTSCRTLSFSSYS